MKSHVQQESLVQKSAPLTASQTFAATRAAGGELFRTVVGLFVFPDSKRRKLMITVFYDGGCGLCSREIAHYQKVAPAGAFRWVDLDADAGEFTALGYQVEDGLRLLHARGSDGAMRVGADAFLLIWRALSRWRWLAAAVGLPVVKPAARWLYRRFAVWRFQKNRERLCELPAKNRFR